VRKNVNGLQIFDTKQIWKQYWRKENLINTYRIFLIFYLVNVYLSDINYSSILILPLSLFPEIMGKYSIKLRIDTPNQVRIIVITWLVPNIISMNVTKCYSNLKKYLSKSNKCKITLQLKELTWNVWLSWLRMVLYM
jgi:hypothetical protein